MLYSAPFTLVGKLLWLRATDAAVAYCLSHPKWRLSVQTHKYLGLP